MFVNIENRQCLIVGGGKVALRKVKVLLDFDAEVCVIAPHISQQIKKLPVRVYERAYCEKDLQGCALVVAATDKEELNHEIAVLARSYGIPVNAVDQPEDCTFIFPSYVRKQNVVGAFSSAGNSPVLTQYLKAKMQGVLTDELGEINEYMGSIRDKVKAMLATEGQRKELYGQILEELLWRNMDGQELFLTEDELQDKIAEIKAQHDEE